MSEPGAIKVQARLGYGFEPMPSPAPPSEHDIQKRALALARMFEPKQVVGYGKVRVGREWDGGYVHVDHFKGVGGALSLGIADDASWDIDIVRRNIWVHQFDPTIDKAPIDHPLITFHKQKVAKVDGPGASCLDTLVRKHLAGCERAILKIDIEGDEWPVFRGASAETLQKFSQIVCEFHGCFRHAAAPDSFLDVLTKLKALFEVVHVHGNNAKPFVNVGNVILPSLLEVTFANRRYYEFADTDEVFPTALDRPNLPNRPDLRLGCFKF